MSATIIEKIGWYTHDRADLAAENAGAMLRTLAEIRQLPEIVAPADEAGAA